MSTEVAGPDGSALSEGLGPNARKLASQLQNAAYNCGYEDAHPSNATTRQAKADAKCREVLAALYAECDRLAAAEAEVERLRAALAKIADWDSNWGPFPENNEAWRAMVVVTAREAVPELGPNVY